MRSAHGPALPQPVTAHDDLPRIRWRRTSVGRQPEPGGGAGTQVLHHHVGVVDQFVQDLRGPPADFTSRVIDSLQRLSQTK